MNQKTSKLIRRHCATMGDAQMFKLNNRRQKRKWNLLPRNQRNAARRQMIVEIEEKA